jgi:hypothetical protein
MAGSNTTATTSNNIEHAGMVVMGGNSTNRINMGPYAVKILAATCPFMTFFCMSISS